MRKRMRPYQYFTKCNAGATAVDVDIVSTWPQGRSDYILERKD